MSTVLALFAFALHLVLCFVGAPLLWGTVDKIYARITGQPGPPLFQNYRYLDKLLSKATLLPDTATDLFTIWPLVAFLSLSVVVMLVPGFCTGMLAANAGDYVTIIGLFALGQAAIILAGLETGSAIAGAAMARLALPAIFSQTILFVLLLVFSFLTQSTNLNAIAAAFGERHDGLFISMGFAFVAFLMVAVVESGYKPARQQDLQMIQEATSLGYSGRLLALLEYTRMLRLLAFMNLIICVFLPFGMAHAQNVLSWPGGALLWLSKLLCLGIGLAIFKFLRGEERLAKIPEILSIALALSVLSVVMLVMKVGI